MENSHKNHWNHTWSHLRIPWSHKNNMKLPLLSSKPCSTMTKPTTPKVPSVIEVIGWKERSGSSTEFPETISYNSHRIHGTGIFTNYFNSFTIKINHSYVGLYTSPMDPMGFDGFWWILGANLNCQNEFQEAISIGGEKRTICSFNAEQASVLSHRFLAIGYCLKIQT